MSTAGYEALVALGREEVQHALAGDLDGVERVHAEREALIATLTDSPPRAALPYLREAATMQTQAMQVLVKASEEVSAQLVKAGAGRRAARSYTPHMPRMAALDERG